MKIGVISDTHDYIQPKVYEVFSDVELILHAGDIGTEDVITSLEALAPVRAIHGNVDGFPLSTRYPEELRLSISGVNILVLHIFTGVNSPQVDAARASFSDSKLDLVIYGHSHRAQLERCEDVLLFNPGAAGRRRFSLRPAVGLVKISAPGKFVPEIVYLD